MILADIPIPDLELEAHDGIDVPHDLVALSEPLEPGQMLLLRTLDGVHRCAEVVGLDFTENETIYQLTCGTGSTTSMSRCSSASWPPRPAARPRRHRSPVPSRHGEHRTPPGRRAGS